MQESFFQPILPVENKTSDLRGNFREKSSFKKRSKNRKFDFTEGHNFLCEKLGIAVSVKNCSIR